jgi:hypothetical protein
MLCRQVLAISASFLVLGSNEQLQLLDEKMAS